MFKKFLLGLALLFIFGSVAFSASISNSVTYDGTIDTTKVSKSGDSMTGDLSVLGAITGATLAISDVEINNYNVINGNRTNLYFNPTGTPAALLPYVDDTISLGSSSERFYNLYLSSFAYLGEGTRIGNSSQYWENQVLDLGIFGKYPTLTPFSIGSPLGNYGGFPGALIISGTPELPDPSILLLKVGVGSVQMMYNWDDYVGHSLLVDGGSMIMRNGRSMLFFDQVSSDSIRLSQDSITKSNLVIDFYNKDTWSTAGNVQISGGLIGLSNLQITGTISSLGTITVTAPINTTGGFYPDQSGDLPISGYTEGAIYYSTTTHKMYVSTEAVTGTYSWKEMW